MSALDSIIATPRGQTERANCLSYWFPLVKDAGLPVPRTAIISGDAPNLIKLVEREVEPPGLDAFIQRIQLAAQVIPGPPWFLRTGQTSGKHGWNHNCNLGSLDQERVIDHVAGLVEYSICAGLFGLPYDIWVVREMIQTTPLFICECYWASWQSEPQELAVGIGASISCRTKRAHGG